MTGRLIQPTLSAYNYPLIVKHLLHQPLLRAQNQEIVYRDRRQTYGTFRDRLGRLASGLAEMGMEAEDVVAVMDWDSHCYHECYFALPMAGAILQTVNLRLSPEHLVYTLADTGASRGEAGVPGPLLGRYFPALDQNRGGDVHALRADHSADAAGLPGQPAGRSVPAENGGRRLGAAAFAGAGGHGPRHRHLCRLWHVGGVPIVTVSHPHTHHLTASPEEALDYRTLAGIPAPLVDLRIVDPNMNEVPHDGKR
jgi:hypothetical protein